MKMKFMGQQNTAASAFSGLYQQSVPTECFEAVGRHVTHNAKNSCIKGVRAMYLHLYSRTQRSQALQEAIEFQRSSSFACPRGPPTRTCQASSLRLRTKAWEKGRLQTYALDKEKQCSAAKQVYCRTQTGACCRFKMSSLEMPMRPLVHNHKICQVETAYKTICHSIAIMFLCCDCRHRFCQLDAGTSKISPSQRLQARAELCRAC